jgi:hypothetical protein
MLTTAGRTRSATWVKADWSPSGVLGEATGGAGRLLEPAPFRVVCNPNPTPNEPRTRRAIRNPLRDWEVIIQGLDE